MTTHTKEPWSARHSTRGDYWFIEEEQGGERFTIAKDLTEEEARRIVACVNACAGISTEALEAGALAALVAEATETLRNIACADGVATGLTQDVEALEAALAKLRGGNQPLRVQIYPLDQDTGHRGPLHWEGEFNAEVIEDDEERAEVEAKLRASGAAMVGGGAMPLVLILRVGG